MGALLLAFIATGTFIYFNKNPDFRFSKIDTSYFEIGIHNNHAFIEKPNGLITYMPKKEDEKDLEIIWSTDQQELYLLRRNVKGATQLYLVHPITGNVVQKSFSSRPKSCLQAVSKERVCLQSGNKLLMFSFKTNKMEEILPPLFMNQNPESRAKIFSFYHQLEGQLVSYKIDPKAKEIHFKWKDPSNQISLYNQKLTVSKSVLSLPKK